MEDAASTQHTAEQAKSFIVRQWVRDNYTSSDRLARCFSLGQISEHHSQSPIINMLLRESHRLEVSTSLVAPRPASQTASASPKPPTPPEMM